jgi:peptidoglycan/LPS O-acetylase OafA/YrhL
MSFLAFFEQLGETPWSAGLHESEIAYSLIESLHVWSMCLFFGMTIIFDLRLLGLIMRSVPVSEVIRRLQPWTILGFVMMAITGTLLFYAIPLRSFQNIFFRTKMLLMLLAGLNIFIFHSRVFPGVAKWDAAPVPPRPARLAGAFSLALWVCIVVSGRMIAYNWFDCDRQPQTDLINFLTSCVPE